MRKNRLVLAINDRNLDDALQQAELALTYTMNNADALMVKAQVLLVRQDFTRARSELEKYLAIRQEDEDAKELFDLCASARTDDVGTLMGIGRVFHRQQGYSLIHELLSKYGKNSADARQFLLRTYQKMLEKKAKDWGRRLTLDPNGLHCSLEDSRALTDLSPLKGLPLNSLNLSACYSMKDLSPLKGMQLTSLNLHATAVSDLSPLRGMPLQSLTLANCGLMSDVRALGGMPLKSLDLGDCTGVRDLTPLQTCPLKWIRLTGQYKTSPRAKLQPLRSIMTLQTIDGKPAAEFWKQYDAQHKGKQ